MTLLPVHAAHRMATAKRWALGAFSGARAKAATIAVALVLVALAAVFDRPILLPVALVALVLPAGIWALSMVERPVGLFLLSRRDFPLDGIAPARETLRLLGLDDATVSRIVADVEAGREVRLASFDQENRLLSEVGPIPYFANELITRDAFIPRIRHRLEVVAAFGVVAIRKAYQSRISIENEALALAALAHLEGVPRIVRLDWGARVMYQSFLPGENLGSLMAARGASVTLQHRVATDRPPKGSWTEELVSSAPRREALRAMLEVAPPGLVDDLGRMLDRIHQAGVTLGDIKYGNVLVQDGRPVLCDFDWSRVLARRGIALLDRRDDERDQFNYIFGGALPTVHGMGRELISAIASRPEFGEAAVDLGGGLRFGTKWTLEAGTGRWRVLRPLLPRFVGLRVVDLGTPDAIVLLEMLRAGAAHVTLIQPDAVAARFARICHRLVELVDNREYDLRVVAEAPPEADDAARGYDIATAFGAFDELSAERMHELLTMPARGVRQVAVQHRVPTSAAALAPVEDALRRSGFRIERTVAPRYLDQALLVASR